MEPKVGFYYQHRYGGLYKVIGTSTSTVDKSKWVVYVHCYPFEYQIWHRPYDEFVDGRFTVIDNNKYVSLISKDQRQFQEEINAARDLVKG